MPIVKAMPWLALAAVTACHLICAVPAAVADENIKYCSLGSIRLASFGRHIAELRRSNRYDKEAIDKLVADEKAGGPDFFSSQIVIKEEQSGSGDFDLYLFQGYSDPDTKYHGRMKWACDYDDYPVAYFVGFKVREICNGAIYISREKGSVNVISLNKIDPNLDKHTIVKEFQTGAVLCEDVAKGCGKGIFYGDY